MTGTTPPGGPVPPGRRPRGLREWPLAAVLALAAVGIAVVASGHVKRGCVVLGGALLVAAALRTVLPARGAGMLAVRSRVFDVATTGILGAAVVVLTLVVPRRR